MYFFLENNLLVLLFVVDSSCYQLCHFNVKVHQNTFSAITKKVLNIDLFQRLKEANIVNCYH